MKTGKSNEKARVDDDVVEAALTTLIEFFKGRRTLAEAKAADRILNTFTRERNRRLQALEVKVRGIELLRRQGHPDAGPLAAKLGEGVQA